MRNRWTARLATLALVMLAGSGVGAHRAAAAEAKERDLPFLSGGFSGWQIVESRLTNVPNGNPGTARCPLGKKVLGGGGEATGQDATLVATYPTARGTAWSAVGRSATAADVDLRVWAICARVS